MNNLSSQGTLFLTLVCILSQVRAKMFGNEEQYTAFGQGLKLNGIRPENKGRPISAMFTNRLIRQENTGEGHLNLV